MDDEVNRLLAKWRPAALKAAHSVARRFFATEQERADLKEHAPVALWQAIVAGRVGDDTPPAHVVVIVGTRLIQGPPHCIGIKTWRPDVYTKSVVRGRKVIYAQRPRAVSLVDDLDGGSASEIEDECLTVAAAALRSTKLTPDEEAAIFLCAAGLSTRQAARVRGIGRGKARTDLVRARHKLAPHHERIRDLLA